MKNKKNVLSSLLVIFALATNTMFFTPKAALAAGDGFWHTNGGQILDANNQPVKMAGINWFGIETASFAPHGLWSRGYKEMMDQIKSLGFNTIRLPFSNQALDPGSTPNGIDFTKNPDLQNLSPLGIMDKVVNYAGQIGLKVMLDQHRPDSNGQSALWYAGDLSESKWISDWQMLADHYKDDPVVIAMDLHNEPHDNATWGDGNQSTDWKMAATKAGDAILKINPKMLIVVEGTQAYNNDYYWWGGNLGGVKDSPITLDVAHQLVYSAHDYPSSVSGQSWFNDSNYPNNLSSKWDNEWGYIQKNNIAPVILGEFGTKLQTDSDKQWLGALTNYLKSSQISWTYWSLNPNSGDTGGILNDDWTTVNQSKMDMIKGIQSTLAMTSQPVAVSTQPTPTPAPIADNGESPTPTTAPAAPTATPTPTVAPQTSGNTTINNWWPIDGAQVSGTQPFKAVIDGRDPGSYTMYWQVDNGQLNQMSDNSQNWPHKEASVDVTNWNWKGNGPYQINFVAKDSSGNQIGSKSININIQH